MNHYIRNKQSLWPVVLGIDGHKLGKDQKSANYPSLSSHPAAWEHGWQGVSNAQQQPWQSSVNSGGLRETVTFRTGEGCWVFGLDGDWRGLCGLLPLKGQRSPATSCLGCLAAMRREGLRWCNGKERGISTDYSKALYCDGFWWICLPNSHSHLLVPFGKLTVFLGSRSRHRKSAGQGKSLLDSCWNYWEK